MEDYGHYHVEVELLGQNYVADSYAQANGKLTRISKVAVGGADIQNQVYIYGYSFKTGKPLNISIGLSREAMDELAQKWLEARGYTVTEEIAE